MPLGVKVYPCQYCGRRNGKIASCQECGMMICYRCVRVCQDCSDNFCMKHVYKHECLII